MLPYNAIGPARRGQGERCQAGEGHGATGPDRRQPSYLAGLWRPFDIIHLAPAGPTSPGYCYARRAVTGTKGLQRPESSGQPLRKSGPTRAMGST